MPVAKTLYLSGFFRRSWLFFVFLFSVPEKTKRRKSSKKIVNSSKKKTSVRQIQNLQKERRKTKTWQ